MNFPSENEYQNTVEQILKTASNFCKSEMCEADYHIPDYNFILSSKTLRPAYIKNIDTICFPSYENAIRNIFTLYETSVHEMSHHIKNKIEYHINSNIKAEKVLPDGKTENINLSEFVRELSPKEIESILKSIEKELKINKHLENDKKQKWEEGVAYRVQERFLSLMRNSPGSVLDKVDIIYKKRFQKPESVIFEDLAIKPSKEFFKHLKNTIAESKRKFNNPDILTKIKYLKGEFQYLKNSREGWLVVRKIPTKKFKALLKDVGVYNKIDWSK